MGTFIKVTEVWVPTEDRMHLTLGTGLYGDLADFQAVSRAKQFEYGRGLPGRAWSTRRPQILKSFEGSYFERTEAAHAAGITAGIALPVFAGDVLSGVVLFLCGDDADHVGAIEVWECDTRDSYDMRLVDGYFGRLDHFEFLSRNTGFRKGTGLPGQVWESGMPVLMDDLGKSHGFLRAKDAEDAGMTSGLGLPVYADEGVVGVMAFLSAKSTPIARRMEVWVPTAVEGGAVLRYSEGLVDGGSPRLLAEACAPLSIERGQGVIGRAWLTGSPMVGTAGDSGSALIGSPTEGVLALPVLEHGRCKAMVVMFV